MLFSALMSLSLTDLHQTLHVDIFVDLNPSFGSMAPGRFQRGHGKCCANFFL